MRISPDSIFRLGLSGPQSRIYFYLLANPDKGPVQIAESIGMTRVRILQILKELKEHELVVDYKKGRNTFYIVNDVKYLERYSNKLVDQKASEIKQFQKEQEDILSEIKTQYSDNDDFIVNTYEGKEGLKESIDVLIEENPDELFQITNFEEIKFPKGTKYFEKCKEQYNLYTAKKRTKTIKKRNVLYLNYDLFKNIKTNIMIFNKFTVITNTKKEKYNRLIIRNKRLAATLANILKYIYIQNKKDS